MSELTRRQVIRAGVAFGAALGAGTAAAEQDEAKTVSFIEFFLHEQLTPEYIKRASSSGILSQFQFAGLTYWVMIVDFGDSISHTAIGVYAPDKEGVFQRRLAAESWPAGILEASVDKESGLLEVRERADDKSKGPLVLACNLRTVGTQHSVREK